MASAVPKVPTLVLSAPLQGWVGPLAEVPDAVFSSRMMGDGVAIDPTDGVLTAPCDGVVVQAAKHAVTLRARNGAEILMHVGLDTVALDGRGFRARVAPGELVSAGQTLLEFDLAFLAPRARSLVTPIIITNDDAFAIVSRVLDAAIQRGGVLMEIAARDIAQDAPVTDTAARRDVMVLLAHGIHARPAAVLAGGAKRFAAECFVLRQGRRANARSISALMALGVRHGDSIVIEARGGDAAEAVDALAQLLASGLGEQPSPLAAVRETVAVPSPAVPQAGNALTGVRAAPGLALGVAVAFQPGDIAVEEAGQGIAQEAARLREAIGALRAQLEQAAAGADAQGRGILLAHVALLEDPEIAAAAQAQVAQGKSAGFSFRNAIREQAAIFRAMEEPRMRERAADLLDLERQFLTLLTGKPPAHMVLPDRAIVLAEELLPSEFLALDTQCLAGIAMGRGGPTSHVAILAAAAGVPALVGLGAPLQQVRDGANLLLDADAGLLHLEPDAATTDAARARIAARARARDMAQAAAAQDARTRDGVRIEVFANLGGGADEAAQAVRRGAEGCGLLRTEFLFMERATPPGEQEQFETYQAIADALEGRPLILRTFDIGGDKPVAYLKFPHEDNPMMGLRGIRAGFHWPDLLRAQVSAALRVRPLGQCRIMLPMVSSLAEIRRARAVIAEVSATQGAAARVSLGIMVETPASALLADQLLAEADFLSIGTNDLTQYVLAMDRGNALLASQIDALHPAVLRLIATVGAAGIAAGKPVGMCGGLAADPLAAPLLVGLGVTELSMPPVAIAAAKAAIASVTLAQCRDVARQVLELDTMAAIRALLQDRFGERA